jgi:hemerythrin-like domain-containing protein
MTATAPTAAAPDTHEMVVVHRIFRRELGLLPRLVRGVADGDTARAAIIAGHATDVLTALHHHHTGEDELLWPLLHERATMDTAVVERMELQHEAAAALIEQADELLPRWAASADRTLGDSLAGTLGALEEVLLLHLREEEQHILPLADRYVSAAEWNRLAENGRAAMPKDKQLIFLGAVLEDAEPDERAKLIGGMPLTARVLWFLVGRRVYGRYVRSVRGA